MKLVVKESISSYSEKNSKFISICFQIKNLDDFKEKLYKIKETYKDANHYTFALRVLSDKFSIYEKFSDDKEPYGYNKRKGNGLPAARAYNDNYSPSIRSQYIFSMYASYQSMNIMIDQSFVSWLCLLSICSWTYFWTVSGFSIPVLSTFLLLKIESM